MNLPYLSKHARNLMSRLLQKNPASRPQTINEVMKHSWFEDVNWKDVLDKKVRPPMLPNPYECYFEKECVNLPLDFDEDA
jgi:serine/threonine protein kinase